MKRSTLASLLFFAATLFFFASCGGDGSKEQTTTDSTTTVDTSANLVIPPANTIVTTPQSMMAVQHKVADFAKWKMSYEEHDSMRLANGIHSYVIGRGLQDSNTVLVVVKVDDMVKAKAFAKDASLKKAMQKGGVTGAPTFSFINATWQDTSNIGGVPRSMTSFSIKDWDTWLKNFEDGKQERLDNGITVRVVGHDPDNTKKVMLVTALTDTAKAMAYWKSDALKKRREAGGVLTEPKRFLFTIAQRY